MKVKIRYGSEVLSGSLAFVWTKNTRGSDGEASCTDTLLSTSGPLRDTSFKPRTLRTSAKNSFSGSSKTLLSFSSSTSVLQRHA